MFEQTLAYLGLQFAKIQFRNDIDHVQPLTDFFRSARSILIALPAGYEEAILAGNALRRVKPQMDHRRLTVVHMSTRATALADFPRCEVVRIDPGEVNRFSLPSRKLLHRILRDEFSVAIDLNLDFVLHTAYICKASRAPVRVGFARPASDVFFNVQMNVHQRTPQAIYESFASCLAMF